MRTHQLKTWPIFFDDVLSGKKKYEVRHNDRGFDVGDNLQLMEWDPLSRDYTGRVCVVTVIYITQGSWVAGGIEMDLLAPGICVMGIEVLP